MLAAAVWAKPIWIERPITKVNKSPAEVVLQRIQQIALAQSNSGQAIIIEIIRLSRPIGLTEPVGPNGSIGPIEPAHWAH